MDSIYAHDPNHDWAEGPKPPPPNTSGLPHPRINHPSLPPYPTLEERKAETARLVDERWPPPPRPPPPPP